MNGYLLIIPAVIILILITPLLAESRVSFNLQSKRGVISLFVFGLQLMYQLFEIDGKQIILKNKKETKIKEIDLESQDLLLIENFIKQIKDKTHLKELFIFYNLGAGDAFLSALVGGIINIACLILFTNIKSQKPTASLGVYDNISYNKTIFEIALKTKISVSLLDVAYSFINSVILTWKTKSSAKHNM